MKRLLFVAVLSILAFLCFILGDRTGPITTGLVTGFATAACTILIEFSLANSQYLRIAFRSLLLWNRDIRISASYLFRIEIANKFLLVRGHRYPTQFQPVGGVYKTTPAASQQLRSWGSLTDNLIPVDSTSENDLRIRVKGKHLISFLRWFDSQKQRETSPWREFQEEMIATHIVSAADFPYIYHSSTRRVIRPLRFSSQAQSYELLIADVVELLPTAVQEQALLSLASTADVRWFTADQILRRGSTPGMTATDTVAETAEWTL